jgi:hypothetical protein
MSERERNARDTRDMLIRDLKEHYERTHRGEVPREMMKKIEKDVKAALPPAYEKDRK